jgi:hypothetical protein
MNNLTYFINSSSTLNFELGTYEYPFKNIDSPSIEVFNFFTSNLTIVTIYFARNESFSFYDGLAPLTFINLKLATLIPYGDPNLNKPSIYVRNNPY